MKEREKEEKRWPNRKKTLTTGTVNRRERYLLQIRYTGPLKDLLAFDSPKTISLLLNGSVSPDFYFGLCLCTLYPL